MPTLSTIGNLIDGGYGIAVTCLACPHYGGLDLPAVSARYGRDLVAIGEDAPLRRRLRCSRCGSAKVQITVQPPGLPRGYR